jgi:hypothetical protein
MADRELLAQIKASREAKTRSVTGGDASRFEWSYDKAARIGGEPYYRQPSNYRSPDLHSPQDLGEHGGNLQGAPGKGDGYYHNDSGDGGMQDRWADGRLAKSNDGMLKPGNNSDRAGASYSGVGSQASHAYGRPSRKITDNPSGAGRGARRGR